MKTFNALAMAALLVAPPIVSQAATPFTYQGRITNAGVPINGTVDLRFSLHTLSSGGTQLGSALTFPATVVAGGLVTKQLDFGDQFDGDPRFLQIEIDPDGGADGFIVFSQRREVMLTPYAAHAQVASDAETLDGFDSTSFGDGNSLDAADGSPTNVVTVDNAGLTQVANNFVVDGTTLVVDSGNNRVGIGTAIPAQALDVSGNANVSNSLTVDSTTLVVDSANNRVGVGFGTPGKTLDVLGDAGISNGLTVDGITLHVDALNNRVGVGTITPAQPLDVVGNAQISANLLVDTTTLSVDSATNRVGVGTATPAQPLDVVGNVRVDTTTFFVDASNNRVGVGTATPASSLDVVGISRFGNSMTVDTDTLRVDALNNRVGIGTDTPGSTLDVVGDAIFDVTTLRVDAINNRVGIGTGVPSVPLDVVGSAQIDGTTFNVDSAGNFVGIRTDTPAAPLHVAGAANSNTVTPGTHVGYFHNTNAGSSADVLMLQVNVTSIDPTSSNNFITFVDGNDTSVGAIEGNGSGGIQLTSGSADYAEWLPRLDVNEILEQGDVVGVFDGRITRRTDGATAVMVLSSNSIISGNTPRDESQEPFGNRVAFVGQAAIKVLGAVNAGDLLLPSGNNDGLAIAMNPAVVRGDQLDQVIGRAWESSSAEGVKSINALVGLPQAAPVAVTLVKELRERDERLELLEERMAMIEQALEKDRATVATLSQAN